MFLFVLSHAKYNLALNWLVMRSISGVTHFLDVFYDSVKLRLMQRFDGKNFVFWEIHFILRPYAQLYYLYLYLQSAYQRNYFLSRIPLQVSWTFITLTMSLEWTFVKLCSEVKIIFDTFSIFLGSVRQFSSRSLPLSDERRGGWHSEQCRFRRGRTSPPRRTGLSKCFLFTFKCIPNEFCREYGPESTVKILVLTNQSSIFHFYVFGMITYT